jgi:chromosome partitioning protein
LAKTLAEAAQDGYDLTVLDTAPSADRAAMLAAEVADLIVVPCRPATFDIEAIQTTLEVTKLKKRRAVVVLNAAPIRSKVVDEARSAIVRAGGIVSPVVVCQRVAYQHCLIDGRTAGEYEPGGAAADEVTRLLHDMMTRLQPDTPAMALRSRPTRAWSNKMTVHQCRRRRDGPRLESPSESALCC